MSATVLRTWIVSIFCAVLGLDQRSQANDPLPLPLVQKQDENAERLKSAYSGMCAGDHLKAELAARLAASKITNGPTDDVCKTMKARLEGDDIAFIESEIHFEQQKLDLQPRELSVEYAILNMLKDDMRAARPYILSEESEDTVRRPGQWNSAFPGLSDAQGSLNDDSWLPLAPSLAVIYDLRIEPDSPQIRRNALQLILSQKTRKLDGSLERVHSLNLLTDAENLKLVRKLQSAYSEVSDIWVRAALRQEMPDSAQLLPQLYEVRDLEKELDGKESSRQAIPANPRVSEVQAALSSNDALVEYATVWFPTYKPGKRPVFQVHEQARDLHYVAYVLSHTGGISGFDLGPVAGIDPLIDNYRCAIEHPSSGERRWTQIRAVSQPLYSLLWKPLIGALRPTRDAGGHVYVSPDAHLALLPFDALVDDSAQGHYLLSDWRLSYLTSGRQLPTLRTSADSAAVNVGDGAAISVFIRPATGTAVGPTDVRHNCKTGDSGLSREYEGLGGTEKEAELIRAQFPEARIFGAKTAGAGPSTEANLKALHSPRILHLATHGYYVSPSLPDANAVGMPLTYKAPFGLLRAGLILGEFGTGISQEDGALTALEIALLDLRNTDLVVLSACDSGLGDATPGDSVGGMRNAFHVAGAKALVSSLWTLSDVAAPVLMGRFYSELARGRTVDSALRTAKLCALEQKRDPYYWAPFVLDGKPDVCLRNKCSPDTSQLAVPACDTAR